MQRRRRRRGLDVGHGRKGIQGRTIIRRDGIHRSSRTGTVILLLTIAAIVIRSLQWVIIITNHGGIDTTLLVLTAAAAASSNSRIRSSSRGGEDHLLKLVIRVVRVMVDIIWVIIIVMTILLYGRPQFDHQGNIGIKGDDNRHEERHHNHCRFTTTTIHGYPTFTIIQ